MNQNIAKKIENINKGIIPEGYKKTKVGIVPVEWKTIKLKYISKHITEKNKDMKYNETYTNSATQGIIKQTDYFDKQISNAENISGYFVVKQNDYVYNPRISVSAPCGPISKSHFSETGIMSPLYTVFRLNDEYGSNEYIEHYFKSSLWHRYMSSVANYGARHDRMNITNEDLFNMPLPLPPVPEQQKIAEILSTQDKLIELQERKIEQLKTLKKGYLQKMFPKKGSSVPELRFKGFTDAWEQCELINIADILDGDRGKNYPTESDFISDGHTLFLNASNVTKNGFLFDDNQYISEEKSNSMGNGKLQEDDIIVTSRGSLGHIAWYNADIMRFVQHARINSGMLILRKKATLDSSYLYQFMKSHKGQNQISFISFGSAQPQLTKASVEKLKIDIPHDTEEQIQIGTLFTNLDRLITLHQRKLDEEKQKKKALMQLLLTGKVRVV